jgi:hypothetical protein
MFVVFVFKGLYLWVIKVRVTKNMFISFCLFVLKFRTQCVAVSGIINCVNKSREIIVVSYAFVVGLLFCYLQYKEENCIVCVINCIVWG